MLDIDYMPLVTVCTSGKGSYVLTRLAWLSEEAIEIQETAVELLIERSNQHKFRDQYMIR